jgi:hypothetical protein
MKTMKSDFISQQAARDASGPKPSKRLYSMAALMRERNFVGKFDTANASYEFTFAPTIAKLNNGKLELTGNLSLSPQRGARREAKDVRATLLAIQSGVNYVPALIVSRNKLNPAKGSLPFTEATDETGYAGVMYFALSPINARALGLTIDLSNVQLNARLLPDSEIAQELHVLYTDVVAAAYRGKPDTQAAEKYLAALNRILSAA